jgi:probable DNA repair protein
MLPPLIDISIFKHAIEQNQLIITANQRLQAAILDAWHTQCATTSLSWQTPRIFSIDNWSELLWQELQDQTFSDIHESLVLDEHQMTYYWETSIKIQSSDKDLKHAATAAKTHALLNKWLLSSQDINNDSLTLELFNKWQKTFKGLLRKHNCITPEDRVKKIISAFKSGELSKEIQIHIYGFQSLTPLHEKLLAVAGDCYGIIHSRCNNKNLLKVELRDRDDEIRAATTWATKQLISKPSQRIGIIIPDLNRSIEKVARIMNESLDDNNYKAVVNISAGTPLSKTPLISTALNLLDCLTSQHSLGEWLHLLYSPNCLFNELPLQHRVKCELELREARKSEFNLHDFCFALLPSDIDQETLVLLAPLLRFRDYRRDIFTQKQTFSEWSRLFSLILDDLGWPGKRSLNTIEFQQKERWQQLLVKYAQLDNLNIKIGIANAIRHLKQMAKSSIFHPKTDEAPIHILGMLEGVGLKFDNLWITNMDSQRFPPQAVIDPIIPPNFQRQHQMPHSLPERELAIAKQLLKDFTHNSETLILSYASMDGDENLFVSPLIKMINSTSCATLCGDLLPFPSRLDSEELTFLFEDSAPPLSDQETISVGVSMFKNQSTCPFNAFAIHRLKSDALKEPKIGLTALDRGSIMHDVMFKLWRKWGNSSSLHTKSELLLQNHISEEISNTLNDWSARHPILRGKHFAQIEQARLEKLIWQWIEYEKTRPAFIIYSLEKKQSLSIGGLNIALRTDRIDKIGNKLIIVDYKSGSVRPSDWSGDRPRDPQLPLYVSSVRPMVNGCAFAQLKTGDVKFLGVSDHELIPNEKSLEDWNSLTAKWRDSIERLATEFSSGHANVEIFHRVNFDYQEALFPLNRWPEESLINKKLSSLKDNS